MRISFLWAAGVCLARSLAFAGQEAGPSKIDPEPRPIAPQHADFFEARIRPILTEHCFRCHGPKKQESGLRLDSRAGLLKGTDAGPVVVAGRPEESPLIEAIHHNAPVKMPPNQNAFLTGSRRRISSAACCSANKLIRMGIAD